MSFKNTVVCLLVVVISASWIQATSTGFSRQDTRTAPARNAQSPPTQQNHNRTPPSYNLYGAMINQHNITYNSGTGHILGAIINQINTSYVGAPRGNINGAKINQTKIVYENQGSNGGHGPSTQESNAFPTLNKMKKFQLKLEKRLVKDINSLQCVNGTSNTEQLEQMKDLLIKVREEGSLLTELHKIYRSYLNVHNVIAMECSSDKSYNVLEWISDARFVILDRLEESHNLFKKLRQS